MVGYVATARNAVPASILPLLPPKDSLRVARSLHQTPSLVLDLPFKTVSVDPERSEVINGPNLGGFLGLAPDLRRLGRQGLAWPSGTQGLGLGISQRAA